MKALVAKIAGRPSIGLYIDEREITVCKVASTPFGPVKIATQSAKYEPDQLKSVVRALLTPQLQSQTRKRFAVTIGVPTLRVFFSTRPVKSTTKIDATPQVLLHEALQSTNLNVDEMVVELLKSQAGKRQAASFLACRKKYMTGLIAALPEAGLFPPRAEPAPCALVRAAQQLCGTPRKAKVVMRAFLGQGRGLAVILKDNQPIVWRTFDLPTGRERLAIFSVTRVLQALIKHCGIEIPVDVVAIHGHPALRAALETVEFQEEMGIRVLLYAEPELTSAAVAYGLALAGYKQPLGEFDLARSLKPLPSFRDLFPWGELALQAALVVCMGLLFFFRTQSLDEEYETVRADNAHRAWSATIPLAELEKEKKDLHKKVEGIRSFLAGRISWSCYTHDVANRLPPTASLISFQGLCELDLPGQKNLGTKPKRTFILRAVVPMAQEGAMPQEIDTFLDSLRANPLLKRDFSVVELAELKSSPGERAGPPHASFTVTCLPSSTKAAAAPKKATPSGKTK